MTERLVEDVKIVADRRPQASRVSLAERLSLNSGVEASPTDSGFPYRRSGFLPKGDWSAPGEQELAILTATSPRLDAARTVQLVSMPAPLFQSSRRLGLEKLATQEEVQRVAIQRSEEFGHFMAQAKAFGESFLGRREGFSSQSVRCERKTGLRSSTLDQSSGQYIGLHIDNWDDLPMRMRESSRGRLVLNLGSEPRFVVFVNLTVAKMARMIAAATGSLDDDEGFGQIGGFFHHFRSYPVTRLRVDPGEGYIAPVDNFFHDGTTTGKESADVTHSMLGHFRAGAADDHQILASGHDQRC